MNTNWIDISVRMPEMRQNVLVQGSRSSWAGMHPVTVVAHWEPDYYGPKWIDQDGHMVYDVQKWADAQA